MGQRVLEGAEQARGDEAGSSAAAAPGDPGDTEAIVQACVRQVMHILTRNKER